MTDGIAYSTAWLSLRGGEFIDPSPTRKGKGDHDEDDDETRMTHAAARRRDRGEEADSVEVAALTSR